MKLKTIIAQLSFLPEFTINATINSIAYSIRRPMIMEALKEEPNLSIIHTLKQLDEALADAGPDRMRSLEETALFVLNANPDTRTEVERRNTARAQLMRKAADGKIERPRNSAHLEQLIQMELHRNQDEQADNFGKAIDAVTLIESCHGADSEDEITYDEGELPEWIADSIHDKVLQVALDTFGRARRDLGRNPSPFSAAYTKASAAREGALHLLDKFDITEEQVIGWDDTKMKSMEAHFSKLEQAEVPVPTIDEPAPSVTTYVDPKSGRKVHRVSKQMAKGITSSDMKAANGT